MISPARTCPRRTQPGELACRSKLRRWLNGIPQSKGAVCVKETGNWMKIWKAEEEHAFSGWDFSHLAGRQKSDPLPWDYRGEVLDGLKPEHRLLDMGTGGGEFLRTLAHPPENTAVTEGYAPNLALCRERLAPLGVDVREWSGDGPLPFADGLFDRVINRHECFSADEAARVLKPGGWFVTQQVGGQNCIDLRKRLGFAPPPSAHDLAHNVELLRRAGFEILRAQECFNPCRFFDTGALVFHARVIEWEFPGFTVERCFDRLLDVQREIGARGFIEATEHRFLVVARRGNA